MTVSFDAPPPLPRWIERELPWRRRVARVGPYRVHFIDEGSGPPVLLVHGNPTWCFLWRKVIERLLPHGLRVIAPDLVGLGLSDKPRRARDHTLEMHLQTMCELVQALRLERITLVGQDWGGPIAAGVGSRHPELVHGLVLANTAVLRPARPFRPTTFHRFSHWPLLSDAVFRGLKFPVPIMDRAQGERESLNREVRRAYHWPLRHFRDRTGPLALARMVPTSERHPSTRVMDEVGAWVERFEGPAALVWGTSDPILGRSLRRHRQALPHAKVISTNAGHFLQEEVPTELAAAIVEVAHTAVC